MERNILETKNNLDRGDRIIDGVSSVGGQLKNLVTPDMYKNKYGAYEKKDRTVSAVLSYSLVLILIIQGRYCRTRRFHRRSDSNETFQ